MSAPFVPPLPLEVWGGVECTVNRVGDCWFDQLRWSGHDARAEDLDAFAALGIRTLRYPLLWERLAPNGVDQIDWRWSDDRMARLRDLGIRPIVGLIHHGSGPPDTSLLDPDFPVKFTRFARAVAERYPWVRDFTPVNEPLTTARFSALYGHWYPHERNDRAFVRALLTQLRATVLAMRAIREVNHDARLIQTEDCGSAFGTEATARQVEHENDRRWLTWDLLCGRVTTRHRLYAFLCNAGFSDDDREFFRGGCRPDLLGLNYYPTSDRYLDERLAMYPDRCHGGNREMRYADVEAVRARPQGIVGHAAHLLGAWRRYQIPVAMTEVHLACTREEQMRWMLEAWHGAERARAQGADVRAITAWALLGSMNWDSLVTRDAGHYEPGVFDVRGPTPRPTALASLTASLARNEVPCDPPLRIPGWWRRPDRYLHGAAPSSSPPSSTDRILIVGATGTLGRAFQRICVSRGLPARLAGRPELDITDPASIDATLRRVRPWAVINAAGYVRVDDAEHDAAACERINVGGASHLAAACRRHGLAFVTYSSDLVFDGLKLAPYVEEDEVGPLNVYGATKREAECRVLAVLPDALVIRTSAFFGPWDEHNFLAHACRTIDRDAPFLAAVDAIVSPTYVPDLVHASLDLLIDGERGIWHLANQGAVTWYEFALMAARASGRPTHRIVEAASGQVWGPAIRPHMSALASSRGQLLRPLAEAVEAFVGETRSTIGERRCASR